MFNNRRILANSATKTLHGVAIAGEIVRFSGHDSDRFIALNEGNTKNRFFAAILGAMLFSIVVGSLKTDEEQAPRLTCPVAEMHACEDTNFNYKGGITFCCGNCVTAFSGKSSKYSQRKSSRPKTKWRCYSWTPRLPRALK
jgi:hypothetical protein